MDYFVGQGFDTWTVDMEGYGRSTKDRGIDATIAEGADDLKAATDYIFKTRNHTGPLLVYGISSGALRAALFAQRHPNRVKRLALDAHVWTGEGSPTLVERARSCRNISRPSGGRSTASSCARSSSATIPAPPTTR